jgi:hypothetical protein
MGEGLVAGVASVRFEPPLGAEMMGYGARTGTAISTHDPLSVRALYLRGGSDLLLLECDVCLFAPAQTDALRERIAARTGVPVERILVGSIHTHSGPDTGFGALLAGRPAPAYVEAIFDAALESARRAREGAAPARLGLSRAEARIGRNRRLADGPLDAGVLVARVDDQDGAPRAVLFVHGCHPTALGHDNLAYSADWPWAARQRIEAALPGATALFALGAHADVDPRTRGLLDLAIPGQSVGVGFEEVESLGHEIGDAVVEAAARAEPVADVPVDAASRRIGIPVHGFTQGEDARREALERSRAEAHRALGLDPDERVGTMDLFRLEHERTRDLEPAERRERIARVRLHLRDRTAARFAFSQEPQVETQVLRLGDALLLGLPLEPTVNVGLDWRRRAGSGMASVVGIANGWMRYLPHADDFRDPEAHQKYEILQSTLVPEAAGRLLDEAESLARGLAS